MPYQCSPHLKAVQNSYRNTGKALKWYVFYFSPHGLASQVCDKTLHKSIAFVPINGGQMTDRRSTVSG